MYKQILYKEHILSYQKIGTGATALMLIHGFPEGGHIFDYQRDELARHCQLIIPNLPGVFNSEFNPHITSIDDIAKAMMAIIAQESIEKIYVMGHSMGGYIALSMAKQASEKILGLGLIHSTSFADTEEKKNNRYKIIQSISQYGKTAFIKQMIPNLFAEKFSASHLDTVQQLIDFAETHVHDNALITFLKMMAEREGTEMILQKNVKKLLLVVGENDNFASLNDMLLQSYLAPETTLKIMKGVGHMSMLESPNMLNKIIADFIHHD